MSPTPVTRTHWTDEEKVSVRARYTQSTNVDEFLKGIQEDLKIDTSTDPKAGLRTAKAYLTFVMKEKIPENTSVKEGLLRMAGDEQRASRTAQQAAAQQPPVAPSATPVSSSSNWVDAIDPSPLPTPPKAPPVSNFVATTMDPSLVKTLGNVTAQTFTVDDVAMTLSVPKSEVSDAFTYEWFTLVRVGPKGLMPRVVLEQIKSLMDTGLTFRAACEASRTGISNTRTVTPPKPADWVELQGLDPNKVYCPHGRPKDRPCPHCMGVGALSSKPSAPSTVTVTPTTADQVVNHQYLTSTAPTPTGESIEDRIALLTASYAELKGWSVDDVELHVRQFGEGTYETWLSGMDDKNEGSMFPEGDTTAQGLNASLDLLSDFLVKEVEEKFNVFQRLLKSAKR